MSRRTLLLLTTLALVAFAANSVLCRMALRDALIDPISSTQIRLAAGALTLAPFLFARRDHILPVRARDIAPAAALFAYALAFSLAYVSLEAGAGALILFAAVQISMIGIGVIRGARPTPLEWSGLVISFVGLSYLLAPGLSAPPIASALLMMLAGAAWGVYSILGKKEPDPVAATARNFTLTLPLVAVLFVAGAPWTEATPAGIALAAASGAIASGLGYVIWYAALRDLNAMAAPIVQLAVPAIAALGGVALLSEPLTIRMLIASALILGGILVALRTAKHAHVVPKVEN